MARTAVIDAEAGIADRAVELVRGRGIVSGLRLAAQLGCHPAEVYRALHHDPRFICHPDRLPAAWSWDEDAHV